MCAPSAPPPPDYAGAAQAQGVANKDAAIATAQLSNANVDNPYGSQRVSYQNDPTTGNPVPFVTQTFSPGQQKLFDTNQQSQQALGELGLNATQKAGNILGQQFDINSIPGIDKTNNFDRESIYNSLVQRATDQNARDVEAKRSQLVAQGIPVGSEAYNREMDALGRNLNDARQQANTAAGAQQSQQLDARRQMITEAVANRELPLNEISALRSGSQVQPLTFSNVTGANVGAAPVFAATNAAGEAGMDRYGIDVGAWNNAASGLFRLGATAAPYVATALSDRRLKSNIVRVGTHPLGIGVYEYDIFGRREIGVMADELECVMPDAVSEHSSGFKAVNYAMIGGRPT